MRKRIWLLFATSFLSSCVAPTPVVDLGPVSQTDFNPWVGNGPATITGQAFLTTNGGDVKTCAGQMVMLIPDNDYVARAYTAHAQGNPTNANKLLIAQNTKTTICDADGNFEFDNVLANVWMIGTEVTWGVPNQYGGMDAQGGRMIDTVAAAPGVNKVILSADNLVSGP